MFEFIDERSVYIKEKLEDQKQKVLHKLSKVFPTYLEDMSKILAHSFLEGVPLAEKIAYDLNLDLLDFYSILEDEQRFKTEFVADMDRQLEQEAYEHNIRYA